MLAGIVGVVVFLYGLITSIKTDRRPMFYSADKSSTTFADIFDNELTLPFGFFMSVWSVLYIQFWSRRNQYLAAQWNASAILNAEHPRPMWYATAMRPNEITGKPEPHFPLNRRLVLKTASFFVLLVMVRVR